MKQIESNMLGTKQHVMPTSRYFTDRLENLLTEAYPMRAVYWKSSKMPSMGTKQKRQALRLGPGRRPIPTAIMAMYTMDSMFVAKNAATSRVNIVISRPQFCNHTASMLSIIEKNVYKAEAPSPKSRSWLKNHSHSYHGHIHYGQHFCGQKRGHQQGEDCDFSVPSSTTTHSPCLLFAVGIRPCLRCLGH